MSEPETPCYKCTAYDHGTSDRPIQKCRKFREEIPADKIDFGCEDFKQRRRFDSGTERLERHVHQFRRKGWMK